MLHPLHVHPLVRDYTELRWHCDGNAQPGGCRRIQKLERQKPVFGPETPRYHCTAGCDYDLCDKCFHAIPHIGEGAQPFDQHLFQAKLNSAVEAVELILEKTRNPRDPMTVRHVYDDKFIFVEALTDAALSSLLFSLEQLGVNQDTWAKMRQWVQKEKRAANLRFKSTEKCVFTKKVERKVEDPSSIQARKNDDSLLGQIFQTKLIHTVHDYYWALTVEYELIVFPGNSPEEGISLQKRTGGATLINNTEFPLPRPSVSVKDPIDVNITWLVTERVNASESSQSSPLPFQFKIDRRVKEGRCRTPRRNARVEECLEFVARQYQWATRVRNYFADDLLAIPNAEKTDYSLMNGERVFNPVVPLFESHLKRVRGRAREEKTALLQSHESTSSSTTTATNTNADAIVANLPTESGEIVDKTEEASSKLPVVLAAADIASFLAEERRTFTEVLVDMAKIYISPENMEKGRDGRPVIVQARELVTASEGKFVLSLSHVLRVLQRYYDAVNFVEDMLRRQLIAAIGREVNHVDFDNFMHFHLFRILRTPYQPRPFSYGFNVPEHCADGILQLDKLGGRGNYPIYTFVNKMPLQKPLQFSINAATKITCRGNQYVHGFLKHSFSNSDQNDNFQLSLRAKQFSCFVVLIGKLISSTLLDPQYAFLVKDKDELTIPLELAQIPSAKEFKDAIESLSPEQQRFCKAYREMQLSSTLFGICMVHVKPQLEKILNLPPDGLAKEINLTRNLLDLFITYQIPSDMLSFDAKTSKQNKPKPTENGQKQLTDQSAKSTSASSTTELAAQGEASLVEFTPDMKLADVTEHAEGLLDMIQGLKNEELAQKRREAEAQKRNPEPLFSPLFASSDTGFIGCDFDGGGGFNSLTRFSAFGAPPSGGGGGFMGGMMLNSAMPTSSSISTLSGAVRGLSAGKRSGGVVHNGSDVSDARNGPGGPGGPGGTGKGGAIQTRAQEPSEPAGQEASKDSSNTSNNSNTSHALDNSAADDSAPQYDFTQIPNLLDAQFLAMMQPPPPTEHDSLPRRPDNDCSAVRSAIITCGQEWSYTEYENLFSGPKTRVLDNTEQERERARAYDLLQALSKSGALAFDDVDLHVVIAMTHCFDETVMRTVIQQNVNPIESVEHSALLVASTIHQMPDLTELLTPAVLENRG